MSRVTIVRKAHAAVKKRMSGRPDTNVANILRSAGIGESRLESAMAVLTGLSDIVGVHPGQLRADDRLATILRVPRAMIDVSDEVRSSAGFGDSVEVLGYDILETMGKVSTRKRFEAQWRQLVPRPKNEEQWIDAIMKMDIGEFVRFFSQAI